MRLALTRSGAFSLRREAALEPVSKLASCHPERSEGSAFVYPKSRFFGRSLPSSEAKGPQNDSLFETGSNKQNPARATTLAGFWKLLVLEAAS
jgi:hypothetical protein